MATPGGGNDSNVQVSLAAATGNLDSTIESTASAFGAAMQRMTKAMQDMVASSTRSSKTVVENNKKMELSFDGLAKKVGSLPGMMQQPFIKLNAAYATLLATLAGGAAFAGAISATNDYYSEVRKLVGVLGIASDEASRLALILKGADVSVDEYAYTLMRFERRVRTGSAALKQMGVDTDALKNGTKTVEQVFREAIGILAKYKEGHDRTEMAMRLLGTRGTGNIAALIKVTKEWEERNAHAAKQQEDFNLTVTEGGLKMKQKYKDAIDDVKIGWLGVEKVIAEAVMPRLTALAEWFASNGPTVIEITRKAMEGFNLIMDAAATGAKMLGTALSGSDKNMAGLQAVVAGFEPLFKLFGATVLAVGFDFAVLINYVRMSMDAFGIYASTVDEARNAMLRGNFSEAWAALKGGSKHLQDTVKEGFNGINKLSFEYQKAWARIWGVDDPSNWDRLDRLLHPSAVPIRPGGTKTAPDLPPKGHEHDQRLEQMREAMRQEVEAKRGFNDETKDLELDFWIQQRATVKTNSDADIKLRRQIDAIIYADRKSIGQKMYQEKLKELDDEASLAKDNVDAEIEIARRKAALVAEEQAHDVNAIRAANKVIEDLLRKRAQIALDLEIKRNELQAKSAEGALEVDKARNEGEVAAGRVSVADKLAMEAQFAERTYAIQIAALKRDADLRAQKLRDSRAGSEKFIELAEEVAAKEEEIERKKQLELLKIEQEAEKERNKFRDEAIGATQDAFTNLFSSLQDDIRHAGDAWRKFTTDLRSSLNKVASKKLMEGVMGPGTEGRKMLEGIFGPMFGSSGDKQTTAANTQMTAAQMQLDAAMAKSGGSIAKAAGSKGFDIISMLTGGGDKGAETTYAGYGLPDFAPILATGTNYIPRDMMAQLHKGEAVVPTKYNNREGIGAARYTTNNNFIIEGAIDRRTQDQIASRQHIAAQRAAYRTL